MIAWIDRHAGRICLAVALIVILAIWLGACARQPAAPTGSAQAAAADLGTRSAAAGQAADDAGRASAEAAGKAAAARAAAQADPTAAKIAAAVAAEVDAAAAAAVHAALLRHETAIAARATAAQEAAAKERADELAAADYRAWVRLCRIVGLAAVALGCLAGGALALWGGSPRLGAGLAALLAGTGAVVAAFGPATAWLPWIVLPAALLAGLAWAWSHRRTARDAELRRAATRAAARAIDAVEREVPEKAKRAKADLREALAAAGLAAEIDHLRGPGRDWTVKG
jgi:hypothetical protein